MLHAVGLDEGVDVGDVVFGPRLLSAHADDSQNAVLEHYHFVFGGVGGGYQNGCAVTEVAEDIFIFCHVIILSLSRNHNLILNTYLNK